MKASAIAGYTTLLLLLALCSFSSSAPVPISVPCCSQYAEKPLPRSHVKEYYETSSRCSLQAVVFVTKRDRQICANPAERWVQDHVNYLKQN